MGRNFPGSGLMRLIRTGQVRINKKRCKPFDRVFTGDSIRIPPFFQASFSNRPSSGPLDIVFENNEFLALNKPGNLPVHPGTGHQDNLVDRVFARYPEAEFKPTPVHRLDKNTTGLILFAKSYSWLRLIQNLWLPGKLEKSYLAWVRGEWKDKAGLIRDNLLRDKDRVRINEKGRPALSWVTPVMRRTGMSLLRIDLATGRKHQIRVQLAERGFPVIGDIKYGLTEKNINRTFLHCFSISWPGHELLAAPDWKGNFKTPEEIPSGKPAQNLTSEAGDINRKLSR